VSTSSAKDVAKDVAKFIATIAPHFPKALKAGDEQAEAMWTTTLVGFLAPYPPDVLERAALHILRTRSRKSDDKWFPEPSECIAVCDLMVALPANGGAMPLLSSGERDRSEFASWRKELADELINSEMGRVAAKQGWIGVLWGFVRFGGLKWDRWGRRVDAKPDTPRLPTADEIAALKAQAKVFDEALEACERGEAGPYSRTLAELGRKMKARRAEKAAIAIGEGLANG